MALTIPSVITRNQSSLTNTDWRSLMDFFKKPEGTETFINYCEKKLGIESPPQPTKTLEERKSELTAKFENLDKEIEALKKDEAAAATPAAETIPMKK